MSKEVHMLTQSALRRVSSGLIVALGVSGVSLASPAQAIDLLNTPPTAVAAATPNPPHAGDTVTLLGNGSSDAQTATADLKYAWTFGDGTTATTSDKANIAVDHVYADAGVYTATLTVTDASGASDSDQVILNVDDTAPVAQATATPSPAMVEQAVAFDGSGTTDQETADADLTFAWTFGDGATSSAVSPSHAYATAGTFTVKLVVTDPQGVSDSKTLTVQVTNSAPIAAGTISPASPTAGESVTFDGSASTDKETPQSLTYSWDFGDATPKASTVSPAHTYAAAGTFPVKLTVTDPQGLATTKSFSLTVGANRNPAAALTASQTKANVGQAISFDGSTSTDRETAQDQLTYAWNFGDGSDTSTLTTAQASHSFAAPGTYTVTLTVTDTHGKSGTATVSITVGNTAPTVAATITPQPAYALQQVTLDGSASTDAETPGELTYSWTFGDGTAATAYGANPVATHTYTAAGSYTATLRVKDPVGSISLKTFAVSVLANAAPVAAAAATPNPTHPGAPVAFDGSGSTDADGDVLTYRWEFADGASAATEDATHTFAALGTYAVVLTVTDTHGVSDTATLDVAVTNAAPVAAGTASPSMARVGQLVSFSSAGSSDADGDTLGYLWEFPDGTSATTATTSHTWSSTGSYPVKLTVTDTYGASATETITVTVSNTAPVAGAAASPAAPHVGQQVTFSSATSSDADGDALTYRWEFPDGSTATTATTTYTWNSPGSVNVTLTVTDTHGATSAKTLTLTVTNDAPAAAYAVSPGFQTTGKAVTFDAAPSTDTETPDSLTYQWSVDGAAPVSGEVLTHTFTTPGNHRVALKATDPQGAWRITTRTFAVAKPVACESTGVVRSRHWKVSASSAQGGKHCRNSVAGRGKMTILTSGDRFGLTFGRISGGGAAKVFVDGTYVGTVSMASASTRLTWDGRKVFAGLGAGRHTVVIRQVRGIGNIDDLLVYGPVR
jgi:PKD repeat protein